MAQHTPDQAALLQAAQEKAIQMALERDPNGGPAYTTAEIAEAVAYSPRNVGMWLGEARRAGIPVPILRDRPNPQRQEARALRDKGHSLPEIAEILGVSAETARRYVAATPPARAPAVSPADQLESPPTPGAASLESAAVVDDPAEEGVSTLVSTKRLQVAMLRAAQAAERDGVHAVAQRFYRDATNLSSTITRLEQMAQAQTDGIHVTQAEIDQSWAKVEAAILAITDRPLHCSGCGQKLSISWAGRDSLEP